MNSKQGIIIGVSFMMAVGFSSPVIAKDYMVETPKCAAPKGSLFVDKGAISRIYQSAGLKNPSGFIEAMIANSGCFSLAPSPYAAQYILKAAPMNEDEFARGKYSFVIGGQYSSQSGVPVAGGRIPTSSSSGDSVLEGMKKINGAMRTANEGLYAVRKTHARIKRGSASDVDALARGIGSLVAKSSSGKMKYAYLEITNRHTGQIYAKGADKSNSSKLSYAAWSRLTPSQKSALEAYISSKKDRRISGALVNAFYDLHGELY